MAKSSGSGYDLKASPSHLLHRAQQFAADRFSAAVGGDSITQRQFAVLVGVAAQEGLTQTDLVKSTGIDRSTLAELVARMTKNGVLKRQRAKTDARANTVSLTPKGKALYAKTLPKVRKSDDTIMSMVPKAKQAAFLSTLTEIAEALDAEGDSAATKAAPKRKSSKASVTSKGKATKRGKR